MTIREHYEQVWNYIGYAIGGYLIVTIGVIALHQTRLSAQLVITFVAGLLALPILWLLARGRFRCPACGIDLMQLDRQQLRVEGQRRAHRGKQFWVRRDACPKCRLSFDSAYPLK